jgi:hypothetical protein
MFQVWSGQVKWSSADGAHPGCFSACGHLFTYEQQQQQQQQGAAKHVSSSSSSSLRQRYSRLPQQLHFTVDTPAKQFDAQVWNAPVAPPDDVR